MERRIKYFEQLKNRFETIQDETVDLKPEKDTKEEKIIEPTGKHEYITRVKARLNTWTKELDRWEAETHQVDLDEECAAQLAKLDVKLLEGFEKMRDLMGTADEEWDRVRENAESLWKEILSTLDQVRNCVGGQVQD